MSVGAVMRTDGLQLRGVHAETGGAAYDAVEWSAAPIADLLVDRSGQLSLVRHLGVAGTGTVWSKSLRRTSGALALSLSGIGRFDGRIGGTKVGGRLRRGDYSFVPPGIPIELEFPAGHSVLHLSFPKTRLDQFVTTAGGDPFEPIVSGGNDRVAQMIWMIDRELSSPGFASDLMVDGLVRALLSLLARRVDPAATPSDRFYLSPAKLKRVIDHVEAHLDAPLNLTDLAAVAGLSVFHFSRMFKLATGESPYHFVGSRRLARAERLLRETELPLSQLALDCGFASQSHFNAAFRKVMGVSPGRYRREHRSPSASG
jgi:AraC family transcriptional regulator